MVVATEEELCEADADWRRQQKAAEQRGRAVECSAAPEEEDCPLEEAGGVCVVRECEWCEEEQWRRGQLSEEEQRGRVLNEPGVRGVAGVGERPVSERHMPDFVPEAEERGKGAEAEGRSSEAEQEEAAKGFDLGSVRERLAAVRAAEAL